MLKHPDDRAALNYSGGHFGATVGGAIDVNGDGLSDVVLAGPQVPNTAGQVLVFTGVRNGALPSALLEREGEDSRRLGSSLGTW